MAPPLSKLTMLLDSLITRVQDHRGLGRFRNQSGHGSVTLWCHIRYTHLSRRAASSSVKISLRNASRGRMASPLYGARSVLPVCGTSASELTSPNAGRLERQGKGGPCGRAGRRVSKRVTPGCSLTPIVARLGNRRST